MPSIQNLVSRTIAVLARDDKKEGGDNNMLTLMIVVVGLVFFSLLLVATLFLLRRLRKQQQLRNGGLPSYNQVKRNANHQGLTIQTSRNGRASILVIGKNGQPMLTNPHSAPHSPDNVPEIHITFPDEHDDAGQRKSGRVLVVRVGDGGVVGLEPVREEQLPAYEKENKSDFYSIDMNQIGGLREKERSDFH